MIIHEDYGVISYKIRWNLYPRVEYASDILQAGFGGGEFWL